MKANLFLLFLSPLSIFLFNNWNPALEDLDLTMSKPPVVERVPSFLLAQVQVHLLLFANNYCSEPDQENQETPIPTLDESLYLSLICVNEIIIFPVILFGFISRPQCFVICYFCTGSCCLGNRWNNLRDGCLIGV